MEQGPKVIDFYGKLRERAERIKNGEYFKEGSLCEFKKSVAVYLSPEKDEVGGGANMLVPVEILPGKYKCLGFNEKEKVYIFSGKIFGEETESEFFLPVDNILEG
jgi:hypothetical protein